MGISGANQYGDQYPMTSKDYLDSTCLEDEVLPIIVKTVQELSIGDLETDNDGQLLIHTGVYRWKDRTYHDRAEE
jgi:hypothetical protein